MIVRRTAPHPHLARLVRHYQWRTAEAGEPMRRIALPARTDVLLEFYFSSPHLLELQDTLALERAPSIAAVGPQTFRRVDLILAGEMDIFTVHFAPTGLHVLLGVPMTDLADAGLDGAALFGDRSLTDHHQRLAGTVDFASRAAMTDDFLMARLAGRDRPHAHAAVVDALAQIRRATTTAADGAMARQAGLSERHFRRLFEQQVGVAPKRYSRIARFEAALAAKAAAPDRSWTEIAHDAGWFDHAHMDKDFAALASAPPSRIASLRQHAAVAVPY